ncbi:MAG: carboxypeptidase-like regulatory domain-containing protein [Bacteroidota bacterium]
MGQSCYRGIKLVKRGTKRNPLAIRPSFPSGRMFILVLLSFLANVVIAQQLLEKPITIKHQNTTLYSALNLISEKAGCFFIYDSETVENDKHVKLEADYLPLKEILDNLLGNPQLAYKVIDQHILIYRPAKKSGMSNNKPSSGPDTILNITIRGHIFDNQDKKPIPYVSIGIQEQNIGTISNTDGYFIVKVPAKSSGAMLIISHPGYQSQGIPVKLLNEQIADIYLDRKIISIQEVIIRFIDPASIVAKAMQMRKVNNSLVPVYMTTFYREGVQKNERFISYSEAVFKVYKSSFEHSEQADQVKLLKSRKVQNINPNDTSLVKLKAGILAGLQLDIVKCIPGFLDEAEFASYTYTYSDLISYNNQNAYAITFVQNKGIEEPLFTGTLYIDKESFAILAADFEINPRYLNKAADYLIVKKSRQLIVKLEKIRYSINYMAFNGRYYISHARCDIHIKTRIRNHLSLDNFSTFLETATCHIDTANVYRFGKQEIIKPNVVFSDTPYIYDETFWGDYNIIAPEEKLSKALSRLKSKIEKIE